MAHTEGPLITYEVGLDVWIYNNEALHLATVHPLGDYPAYDNAYLFAAAPDLYEACKRAHAFISILLRSDIPNKPAVMEELEAAIAKAEGTA